MSDSKKPGVRPMLPAGSPAFVQWAAVHPDGHALLLGEAAAIHRNGCCEVAAASGRVAVCSPDTLPL